MEEEEKIRNKMKMKIRNKVGVSIRPMKIVPRYLQVDIFCSLFH